MNKRIKDSVRTGIVVAMIEEATPIIKLKNMERVEVMGFQCYTAGDLCIIISGVGTLNATLATFIVIHVLGCIRIINYGVAGYTGNEYHQGTIFSVNKIYKRDVDFSALGYERYRFPDKPNHIDLVTDERLPVIECYTSDEFVDKNSKVPQNVLVDMEGFSVAYVCSIYNRPCIIYKGTSDNTIEGLPNKQIDKYLNSAIINLTDYLEKIL